MSVGGEDGQRGSNWGCYLERFIGLGGLRIFGPGGRGEQLGLGIGLGNGFGLRYKKDPVCLV